MWISSTAIVWIGDQWETHLNVQSWPGVGRKEQKRVAIQLIMAVPWTLILVNKSSWASDQAHGRTIPSNTVHKRGSVSLAQLWTNFFLKKDIPKTDLETWYMTVPSSIALRVLGSYTSCSSIGTSEHNGHRNCTSWHVECLGRWIDDLIYGLHGKVEGHEFTDWPKPSHGCTSCYPSKSSLLIKFSLDSNIQRFWLEC